MNPISHILANLNECTKKKKAWNSHTSVLLTSIEFIILWEHWWNSRQQLQNPPFLQHKKDELFLLLHRAVRILSEPFGKNWLVKNLRELDMREGTFCCLKLHLFPSLSNGVCLFGIWRLFYSAQDPILHFPAWYLYITTAATYRKGFF